MDSIISEYLQILVSIDPKAIKPKHHFLVHYSRIMSMIGPLWNISCMQGEAAHRLGKLVSRISLSRVNVHYTIAVRNQLTQCYRFKKSNKFPPKYIFGPIKEIEVSKLKDYKNFLKLFPNNFSITLNTCNWVIFMGKKIKKKSIVVIFSEAGDNLYIIEQIFQYSSNEVTLLVRQLTDSYVDPNFQAYIISDENVYTWCLLDIDFISHVTHYNYLSDNKLCIVKSWL